MYSGVSHLFDPPPPLLVRALERHDIFLIVTQISG